MENKTATMTKLQRIQQFAKDNNCTIEADVEFSEYRLISRETKKVYNWDGFTVEPVASYHFNLDEKGGDVGSPDAYCVTSKSYKTDRGFIKAIDRLQADINKWG